MHVFVLLICHIVTDSTAQYLFLLNVRKIHYIMKNVTTCLSLTESYTNVCNLFLEQQQGGGDNH